MMHDLERLYNKLSKIIDVVSILLSFYIAWFIRFEMTLIPSTDHLGFESYMTVMAFYIIFYFLISIVFKMDLDSFQIDAFKLVYKVIRTNVLTVVFVMTIFYIMKLVDYSRIFLITYAVINSVLSLCLRTELKNFLTKRQKKFFSQETVLFIGQNDEVNKIVDYFKINNYFTIIGFLDDTNPEAIGKVSELENVLNKYHVDEIIICLKLEEYNKIPYIIDISEKYGIRTYIVPDYFRYIPSKARVEELRGIPLINIRYSPLDEWTNRFVKRAFDIFVSLIGLIVCLPLFIIIAILIKLTSKGPILFTQERVGYNRRVFKMHKFRTMYVQDPDEEKVRWTTKDDPRRTPIGKILRRLSLDELPQLWDVLVGNMSLVGPRPERPYFVEKFKEEIPKYMIKHRVRPGITGWAQIHGLRGDTSIEERIKYDIWYIENWSFWLDIKIILATIFGGKFMENAY
ncbi:Undecaprenyl-phosphate glucose phosphotransferase [Caldicellulosiruptor kronotskyensis 2002]|uniref:Undecaprenyl-phosphate glucose phosphotransferase n=2 Tax=Caldicellulosiruptor TaxID=44000 RepID=E4SCB2_CALK2|nr:Undecaprenyl-phosphate glucose phosphotransferase [Caldicellulosiruptor kronotskyensis 2002]